MKSVKNFYRENRILVILMTICLVCGITMGVVLIKYFYSGNDISPYGDRLDGIEEVEITDQRISEITLKQKEDKLITDAKIIIQGRTIFSYLTFSADASLAEAQTKAVELLDEFSEEEIAYYDFHFDIKQPATKETEGFHQEGAKNHNGTNQIWPNNKTSEKVDETKK